MEGLYVLVFKKRLLLRNGIIGFDSSIRQLIPYSKTVSYAILLLRRKCL